MSGVLCRKAKRCQCIRHNIRCGAKILSGCRGKIHDAVNAVKHVLRLPACHRHVVHGISCLRRGELGLLTHLPGFIPESLQVIPRRTGNRGNLAHAGIKVCRGLYCRRTKCRCSCGNRHDGFADILHLAADALQGFALCRDLLNRRSGLICLILEILQLLGRFLDLPLQTVILILGDRSILQRLIGLALCGL